VSVTVPNWKVKAFLDYLTEQGKSRNTRKNHFSAIRNFYKRNYYELTFFRGDSARDKFSILLKSRHHREWHSLLQKGCGFFASDYRTAS